MSRAVSLNTFFGSGDRATLKSTRKLCHTAKQAATKDIAESSKNNLDIMVVTI
jgi:hypothetical protein